MDLFAVPAAWLVNKLVDHLLTTSTREFGKAVLGEPLQRALEKPTADALAFAVNDQLGRDATDETVARTVSVLTETWKPELVFAGPIGPILGQVHYLAQRGMEIACAPVTGLPQEYLPTSSLTALGDELGVEFDPATFAITFSTSWWHAVRDGALSDARLAVLAERLGHERIESLIEKWARESDQAHLGQGMRDAVQALVEAPSDTNAVRERWFRTHVEPLDAMMQAIYDDYTEGFSMAARELTNNRGVDAALDVLIDYRRRRLSDRIRATATVRAIDRHAAESALGEVVVDSFRAMVDAVGDLMSSPSSELGTTWYFHYIEHFEWLRDHGMDPRARENHTLIAGDHDLEQPLGRVLRRIADVEIPARFATYSECYAAVRMACL